MGRTARILLRDLATVCRLVGDPVTGQLFLAPIHTVGSGRSVGQSRRSVGAARVCRVNPNSPPARARSSSVCPPLLVYRHERGGFSLGRHNRADVNAPNAWP